MTKPFPAVQATAVHRRPRLSAVSYGFGDAVAADIRPLLAAPPVQPVVPTFLETAFKPDSPLVKLLVQQFQSEFLKI